MFVINIFLNRKSSYKNIVFRIAKVKWYKRNKFDSRIQEIAMTLNDLMLKEREREFEIVGNTGEKVVNFI